MKTYLVDAGLNWLGRWVYKKTLGVSSSSDSNALKKINIYGHNIYYFDVGEQRPVLLLHGLGASSISWLSTIVGLGKSRRVIAPDQIGHGRSDKPSLKYRVTDFVDYIEEFVDQLRLSQIDIIGNSLGGWIGARLAIKRPDLVKKLVLVAAGGLKPSSEFRREIEKFDFTMSSLSSTRFMLEKSFYNKQRYASTFTTTLTYIFRRVSGNQEIIRTIIKSADEPSEWIDKKLEKIEAETLVLWGREDRILPIDFVEKFAQGIPNVKVEILENCGHVPQIERAKDFNRLVEEFLKSSR